MNELKRIMCVEDDPDIQAVARLALERVGKFTVRMCPSGKRALAEAVEFAPDLILLDVMMPEMDGPTTLQNLRQLPELADVPIAFMTARVQQQELEQYQLLGAAGAIAKPFDPMKLADEVRALWAAHHG